MLTKTKLQLIRHITCHSMKNTSKLRKSNAEQQTFVVLNSSMMCHCLWSEAEAENIPIIGAVAYKKWSVRFILQFSLCFFPAEWTPIPATLQCAQQCDKKAHLQRLYKFSSKLRCFLADCCLSCISTVLRLCWSNVSLFTKRNILQIKCIQSISIHAVKQLLLCVQNWKFTHRQKV